MITLTGKKVSEGIAIGKLSFYKRDIKEERQIYVRDVEKEIQRLKKARERAQFELEELREISAKEIGEANASIFEMQQELVDRPELFDAMNQIILEQKMNAEYAVRHAAENYLKSGEDKGHSPDIRDVAIRLIRILSRSWRDRMFMDEPFVLGADEIYPSEAVQLDKTKILGFITRYGTINSHTAVIARTKGMPSVIGLGDVLKKEYDGKMIIVDGYEGKVYIEPDYTLLTRMKQRQGDNIVHTKNLERLKGKENITQSGQKINIFANIGSREDIEQVIRSDAGGIGLFRSEFLYMENGDRVPTEEQQFLTYKLAAESMGMNPVVIRTADLGGDKRARCVDIRPGENPAMGLRGIRVSLEKQELFKTQLRAILRASAFGNVSIMFPMVTSVEEVQQAKVIIEQAKRELKSDKTPYDPDIRIGVMIETPAAVMLSGELAREADFFSIGTNDLTQFSLGMDRNNSDLADCFDTHHPAVLKMIRIVTNNVHLEEKPISICGDLAADLTMTEQFIQMGIDELSVAPDRVLSLRKKIREIE